MNAKELELLDEAWHRGKFYVCVLPWSDESSMDLVLLRPLHNGQDLLVDPEEEVELVPAEELER